MAKIKVQQDSGTIVVTTAGATRKDYTVSGGTITAHKDDVRALLSAIPGAELVDGTLEEDVDSTVYEDAPPELPAPIPGNLGAPQEDGAKARK